MSPFFEGVCIGLCGWAVWYAYKAVKEFNK